MIINYLLKNLYKKIFFYCQLLVSMRSKNLYKLLRLLPDRHIVNMIMELVRNRSFTLTTGNISKSRLRRLKNGMSQGSVLASVLFNIYTYDLPDTISRKYASSDDLAIMHSARDWFSLEGTLSHDLGTISNYLPKWKLKLSINETLPACFHLNDREARRELHFQVDGKFLPFLALSCPFLPSPLTSA